MTLADQWRAFDHGDPLYRALLPAMADDLEAGGPTAEIFADHLDAPISEVVHLRALAGLFRIVLRGDAPELVPVYPCLGGTAEPTAAWPDVRRVLAAHVDELRDSFALAPQTNEIGRSAALALGLFEAVRRHGLRRVRLLEPGASAGLNLLVDRLRVVGPDWTWGPPDSPLVLDTGATGVRPEELNIVERRGCDLSPVDAASAVGAARLTSFVWPSQLDRHARLAAALEIARDLPVTVDQASAADWVAEQLNLPVDDDVLTVVWHSITAQYWPVAEREALLRAVAAARVPVSHVMLEFRAEDAPLPQLWVDGDPIATVHFHGVPITVR